MAKKRRHTRKSSGSRTPAKKSTVPRAHAKATRKAGVLPVSRGRKSRDHAHVSVHHKRSAGKKGRVTGKAIPKSHVQQPVYKSKKKLEQQKRSFAAKKGWLTRRYNEKIREVEIRYAKLERDRQKDIRKQAKVIAGKEKTIAELRIKGQEIHAQIEKASQQAHKFWQREVEHKLGIMERLFQAQLDGRFDDEAYDIAEEFDMEPREVYTLWAYNGAVD